jgi:hypothetical protein
MIRIARRLGQSGGRCVRLGVVKGREQIVDDAAERSRDLTRRANGCLRDLACTVVKCIRFRVLLIRSPAMPRAPRKSAYEKASTTTEPLVSCRCGCGGRLSRMQEWRHLHGRAPMAARVHANLATPAERSDQQRARRIREQQAAATNSSGGPQPGASATPALRRKRAPRPPPPSPPSVLDPPSFPMDIDPSSPLGDPGPSTLANRLRRLTALPVESDGDPLVHETVHTLRSHVTERPPDSEDEDDFVDEVPGGLDEDPHAFSLAEDEIQEYELTAWDAIDIAIEQEARGAFYDSYTAGLFS